MTDRPNGPWPSGVQPIGIEDLDRLGLNADNELFWDGKRVEIRRALVLTSFQKVGAVIVSICAILGGIGALVSCAKDGAEFFSAREIT